MKTKIKKLVLAMTLVLPAPVMALSVTTSTDGIALANALVGSGVTISNVSLTGTSTQQGTFTGGLASGIGIDSGVILTSGDATLAPGPNNSDGATGSIGTGLDQDLGSLIPGFTIYDKNILEFDFTTITGDLFFSYVFASEEYNEYVNSGYNDVFGFFVDGSNIALIPGTSTPVSINTVNCDNPFTPGAGSNCQFYNNNDLQDGGPFFNIQYDGFTDVFTASILGLSAGTHTMKLAIADAGDLSFDSAVFLKAGSFSTTPPNTVPEPAMLTMLAIGWAGFGARKRHNT